MAAKYDVFDVTPSMFPSLGFVGRDFIRRGVWDGLYVVVACWSRFGHGTTCVSIEDFVGCALDEDIAQELADRAYYVTNVGLALHEPGSGAHGHDVEIWHIVYDAL